MTAIPVSSDTVESGGGAADEAVLNKELSFKNKKSPRNKNTVNKPAEKGKVPSPDLACLVSRSKSQISLSSFTRFFPEVPPFVLLLLR
jgi:hypothetical protein